MKRLFAAIALAGALIAPVGCIRNTASAPTPPLVNQVDQFDADTYRALTGLSVSLNSLKHSVEANPALASLQPSVDRAGASYNVAMTSWKIYHATATAANKASAQAALNNAQTQIDALKAQVK